MQRTKKKHGRPRKQRPLRADLRLTNTAPDASVRSVLVDVSVVHPMKGTALASGNTVQELIRAREKAKVARYGPHAQREHSVFVPFVVSTTGSIGAQALKLLSWLARDGRVLANAADLRVAALLTQLKRRVGIGIQMANAVGLAHAGAHLAAPGPHVHDLDDEV